MISTLTGEGKFIQSPRHTYFLTILLALGEFEASVGILGHVTSSSGIKGILKQRYSDFIVREVTKDGNICRLTEIGNAKQYESEVFAAPKDEYIASNDSTVIIGKLLLDLSLVQDLEMIVPEDEFKEFLTKCINQNPDCPTELLPYQCGVKKGRTEFHEIIKRYVAKYVEGTSVEVKDGPSKLKLMAKHMMKKSNKRDRSMNTWPKNLGNFLEFTLLKENIDTMRAVELIARCLHIKSANIGIAGTKDKRAVTTQRCTIYRGKPTTLERLNNMNNGPGIIRLGDFKYVADSLRLGNLIGNRFEIIIRDISAADDDVASACQQIQRHGFVNYYGLQRFGKGGSRSHVIGRHIYLSNWKEAVDLMFVLRDGDQEDIRETKLAYQAGDFIRALQIAPRKMYSERAVLGHLSKLSNDYCAAFHLIPKSTRLICAHAYQSYLWNMAASERIRLYGLQVVLGDAVSVGNVVESDIVEDDEGLIDADDSDSNGKDDGLQVDLAEDGPLTSKQRRDDGKAYVIVTAEDIAANRYTISDVVLPIPGDESIFPSHAVGDYMRQLMAQDGISMQSYRDCLGQYRTHGSYRRLMQHPIDFQWEILRYRDNNEELAHTELDRYLDRSQSGDGKVDEGLLKLRALALKFTMPPGTYATMLLREITKESTETQYQAQLTANAQDR
jgi:tRNA pseudouridine13 synthase